MDGHDRAAAFIALEAALAISPSSALTTRLSSIARSGQTWSMRLSTTAQDWGATLCA